MLHALQMTGVSLIGLILGPLVVYLFVRLGSAAWFTSKLDYELKKGRCRNGIQIPST